MNIFALDTDVVKAAEYHVDKHCVKMILESTQLLNNALMKNSSSYIPVYKETHRNHPASIWTAGSIDNFEWLTKLAFSLCNEYTYRYGRIHKCQSIIHNLQNSIHKNTFPQIGLTPFIKCMPDQYKVDSAVESYRNYYRADKAYIAKWSKRPIPEWWIV